MLLGQILISEGFCTEKDILEALDAQKSAGDKRRIGEILLSNGTITDEQLNKVLAIQRGEKNVL